MVPDQIKDPDHYEEMPYQAMLLDLTGVHIEYHVIASASRKENFAALLASDDLLDIMISYSGNTLYNNGTYRRPLFGRFSQFARMSLRSRRSGRRGPITGMRVISGTEREAG